MLLLQRWPEAGVSGHYWVAVLSLIISICSKEVNSEQGNIYQEGIHQNVNVKSEHTKTSAWVTLQRWDDSWPVSFELWWVPVSKHKDDFKMKLFYFSFHWRKKPFCLFVFTGSLSYIVTLGGLELQSKPGWPCPKDSLQSAIKGVS